MKNLYLFIQINFIPFKVIPSRYNALMPKFFPIVETLVKCDFRNYLQSLLRFGLYIFNRVKTVSLEWSFEFGEWPEVTKSQIRQIWWLWNEMRLVFSEKVTKNECSVRQRIIVVQKPTVVFPQIRPLETNSFTQTTHNVQIIFFVDKLAGRKEFIMHHTTIIEKTVNMTLIFERLWHDICLIDRLFPGRKHKSKSHLQ